VNSVVFAATVLSFAHTPLGLFRSQQNGAVTKIRRACRVQPSHKERAISVVRCKKEGMLLQPLCWCCVECVIHHEQDVRKEQQYIYVARTSNNRVIMTCELYCWLLPQCEALRICRSGFSDRNSAKILHSNIFLSLLCGSHENYVMAKRLRNIGLARVKGRLCLL